MNDSVDTILNLYNQASPGDQKAILDCLLIRLGIQNRGEVVPIKDYANHDFGYVYIFPLKGTPPELSPEEIAELQQLADNPGETVSAEEMLEWLASHESKETLATSGSEQL